MLRRAVDAFFVLTVCIRLSNRCCIVASTGDCCYTGRRRSCIIGGAAGTAPNRPVARHLAELRKHGSFLALRPWTFWSGRNLCVCSASSARSSVFLRSSGRRRLAADASKLPTARSSLDAFAAGRLAFEACAGAEAHFSMMLTTGNRAIGVLRLCQNGWGRPCCNTNRARGDG